MVIIGKVNHTNDTWTSKVSDCHGDHLAERETNYHSLNSRSLQLSSLLRLATDWVVTQPTKPSAHTTRSLVQSVSASILYSSKCQEHMNLPVKGSFAWSLVCKQQNAKNRQAQVTIIIRHAGQKTWRDTTVRCQTCRQGIKIKQTNTSTSQVEQTWAQVKCRTDKCNYSVWRTDPSWQCHELSANCATGSELRSPKAPKWTQSQLGASVCKVLDGTSGQMPTKPNNVAVFLENTDAPCRRWV